MFFWTLVTQRMFILFICLLIRIITVSFLFSFYIFQIITVIIILSYTFVIFNYHRNNCGLHGRCCANVLLCRLFSLMVFITVII